MLPSAGKLIAVLDRIPEMMNYGTGQLINLINRATTQLTRPALPVETAVLNGLCQVFWPDGFRIGKIGNGSTDF